MQSILLVCPEKIKRDEYIQKYSQTNKINTFDISYITSETTIGVETVRNMQKTAFLKPLNSPNKLIVIENAHTATIEAQNALLKIIEEPPLQTIIILSADNSYAFLSTILSRCSLIEITSGLPQTTLIDEKELQEQLTILTTGTIGAKLTLAQQLAEKKELLQPWIKQIMLYIENRLVNEQQTNIYVDILSRLQEAANQITTTNIQPRFILEHYFLLRE